MESTGNVGVDKKNDLNSMKVREKMREEEAFGGKESEIS